MTRPAAGDRLRVLHLIKGFDVGGAERIISLLVQVGDRERFDYAVAHALAGADGLAGPVRAAGVAVHDLGAAGQWDLRWVARLRRLLRDGGFDVLHVHLPYTAGLGRIAAWSLGPGRRPRVVHTQHNMWSRTEWPTRLLSGATWWMDDADLAVAESVKADLPPLLARRTEVVLHGVDRREVSVEAATAVRGELGVKVGEVLVVTVANLRREKAYEVLLEAARRLVDEGLPVRFAAVGHGPLEQEVRALHRRLGLGERFRLLGLRTDVAEILAAADVFTLASHHEGFPLSVMEALGAGVPVVATRVGELPAVVRDGVDGILVPPGDRDALAAALRTVVADEGRRRAMTVAARDGGARFDIRAASQRLEGLYATIGRPPPDRRHGWIWKLRPGERRRRHFRRSAWRYPRA
ncbi:glycosyltransferase [Acidimicrobiaceae bacterium USS-CC1]|uniref:Glycosyltransferase n=1 Tax=Acidiferrimicrobium australe TaxID=2664430 RepID=A0ABW9QR31_9ACTN|nr:glycosyltransferase [Acidiferrimicrobium australe]